MSSFGKFMKMFLFILLNNSQLLPIFLKEQTVPTATSIIHIENINIRTGFKIYIYITNVAFAKTTMHFKR